MVKWLRRIFSLQSLTVLGTVVSILIAFQQFRRDTGGQLDVSYNTQKIGNNETRDIVIFSDRKELSVSDLCPKFINSDKYTLKDFNLKHTVMSDGVQIYNSDFYISYSVSPNTQVLKYYEDALPPHQATEQPLQYLSLKGDYGFCSLKSVATWDGANKPFEFAVNIYCVQIPMAKMSFDSWKKKCSAYVADNMNLRLYDAIYTSSKGESRDFNLSINLAADYLVDDSIDDSKFEQKSPKVSVADEKGKGSQEFTIVGSYLSDETVLYKIRSSQPRINEAFVLFLRKSNGQKIISGHYCHESSSNSFKLRYPLSDVLVSVLGVAPENLSNKDFIKISGNTFSNTHTSKYIGVAFSYNDVWYSTVIAPKSYVTWKLEPGYHMKNLKYFSVGEDVVEAVNQYTLAENSEGANGWSLAAKIVLIVIWSLISVLGLFFLIIFIESLKDRKCSLSRNWEYAMEEMWGNKRDPLHTIATIISVLGCLTFTIFCLVIPIIKMLVVLI